MDLTIRLEIECDHSDVKKVNTLAFGQDKEARLIDALRKSYSFIPELSIVAIFENELVGHILFTKIYISNSDHISHQSLALAPMAVKPAFQKKGIGRELIRSGLNKARELGHKSVIVLGHENYYSKFGFQPAENWGIRAPFDVPPGVFMAKELVPGSLRDVSGVVQYPGEFDLV